MPDEAVLTAPSAGAESSTAVIDAPSPSADVAATPDTRTMSDDQIMDLPSATDTPAKPEAEDAEAQPEAGQGESTEADKSATEVKPDALAEDGRIIPQKYRELFKNDPELRALFFRDRANAQKLTTIEAELAPLRETAQSVETTDKAFLSGNPSEQLPIIQEWAQQSPQAVASAIDVADQVLRQADPAAYQRISDQRFQAAMKEQEFDKFFTAVRDTLEAEDISGNAGTILKGLLAWGQQRGFAETTEQALARRAKEVETREASLKQSEQNAYQNRVNNFKSESNRQIDAALDSTLKSALTPLLDKSAFSDAIKGRINREIKAEMDSLWAGSAELRQQLLNVLHPGGIRNQNDLFEGADISDTSRSRQVEIVSQFIKSSLPAVAKKVVEEYTAGFMATQKQREQKLTTAASRKDIVGGAVQPRAKAPLTPKDIDYARLSDEDILAL